MCSVSRPTLSSANVDADCTSRYRYSPISTMFVVEYNKQDPLEGNSPCRQQPSPLRPTGSNRASSNSPSSRPTKSSSRLKFAGSAVVTSECSAAKSSHGKGTLTWEGTSLPEQLSASEAA